MSQNYGISESELKLIQEQAARRNHWRQEFLKQKSNPWKHASEAGYVFDPAIQKFNSMKVSQFDHFTPNRRNAIFGISAIIIPMFAYGYVVWRDRNNREQQIRSGELRYKDRLFKLC